jgi:hypothetical protein
VRTASADISAKMVLGMPCSRRASRDPGCCGFALMPRL